MAAPETLEVAHNGDTILVCGTAANDGEGDGKVIKIVASSAILSHGSSVFKSMLGPHFKEGSTLSAQSQVTIPLPDDDPDSMVILCKALHMRFDMKLEEMTSDTLLKLGVVVDKYDCSLGMGALPHYWINKQLATATEQTLGKLLVASFLMNEPEMFQRVGYELQMRSTGDISILLKDEHHADVLQKVIAKLNLQRRVLVKEVMSFIEHKLYGEFEGYSASAYPSSRDCNYLEKRSKGFLRELRTFRLSPISELGSQALADTCKYMREMRFIRWEEGLYHGSMCDFRAPCSENFNTPNAVEDIMDEFKQKAAIIEGGAVRVCLSCVKEGQICTFGECVNGHKVWV